MTTTALTATELSRMSDDLIAADIVLLERIIHAPEGPQALDVDKVLRYSQLVQERHVRTLARGRAQAKRLLAVEKMLDELAPLFGEV